jgi:hypothetical protein
LTGTNINTDPIYAVARNVKCRKESTSRTVNDQFGQMVSPHYKILTVEKIKEGDKVDGELVISIEKWIGLSGREVGRVVYT